MKKLELLAKQAEYREKWLEVRKLVGDTYSLDQFNRDTKQWLILNDQEITPKNWCAAAEAILTKVSKLLSN